MRGHMWLNKVASVLGPIIMKFYKDILNFYENCLLLPLHDDSVPPKDVYLPISKLLSILAEANLLALYNL